MLYQLCTIIWLSPTPPAPTGAIRYLSYSPLTAPKAAAATIIHIQLLVLKSMPSFLPLRLSMKNEATASNTPIHCQTLSRSPKNRNAPTSTITGRVALIGPTMVSGRFFMPKYPNTQLLSTMQLFSSMYL